MNREITHAIACIALGLTVALLLSDWHLRREIRQVRSDIEKQDLHNEYQWETLCHLLEKDWSKATGGQVVEIKFIIDDMFHGKPTWRYVVTPDDRLFKDPDEVAKGPIFPDGSIMPIPEVKERNPFVSKPE